MGPEQCPDTTKFNHNRNEQQPDNVCRKDPQAAKHPSGNSCLTVIERVKSHQTDVREKFNYSGTFIIYQELHTIFPITDQQVVANGIDGEPVGQLGEEAENVSKQVGNQPDKVGTADEGTDDEQADATPPEVKAAQPAAFQDGKAVQPNDYSQNNPTVEHCFPFPSREPN